MNTHALTLRLDEDTWKEIRDLTRENETTISSFIRGAVVDKLFEIKNSGYYEEVSEREGS